VWESDTGDGHPALKYSGSRVWALEGDNKKDIYQSERWSNNGNNGRKTIGNWYNTILQAAGFPPQLDPYLGVDMTPGTETCEILTEFEVSGRQ